MRRTLRLDNNKLSGLPDGLLTLTSLTRLGLRHNNFSNLPYRFGDLHRLQKLDLGENMLKTLPPTMVRSASPRFQSYFCTLFVAHTSMKDVGLLHDSGHFSRT